MARKFKEFTKLDTKRAKRPGRHSKSPNKRKRLSHKKKYKGQGRV